MASADNGANGRSWLSIFARTAFLLAVAGVAILLFASFGSRFGIWPSTTGLMGAAAGAFAIVLGLIVAILTLMTCLLMGRRRALRSSFLAILIAVVALGVPYLAVGGRVGSPPIHDITTDTVNPPEFVDVLPYRVDANSVNYEEKIVSENGPGGANAGKHYREIQAEAYPDIKTVTLEAAPAQAFEQALAAAEAQGWEIVASVPDEGRIEATDTTFWFGFKDDVVIRLTPEGAGTKLDVRSSSRVGMGDVGTNAKRISDYIAAL